jgi:putative DNA-invertase from lambdoid prophage Rac
MVVCERESAAKARPVWSRLLEAARIGEVKAIVVWSLDRIGRNRTQVAHDLAQLCRWGVLVVSVKDSWLDVPPGPLRDLLVQIMAWVAEGERARLIERTHAGLDRARAQGKRLGRPPADPFKLYAAAQRVEKGMSVASAARLAGVPRSTLRTHLAKKVTQDQRN